jgi:hypothetical protein
VAFCARDQLLVEAQCELRVHPKTTRRTVLLRSYVTYGLRAGSWLALQLSWIRIGRDRDAAGHGGLHENREHCEP